jgi:hypothetical protein
MSLRRSFLCWLRFSSRSPLWLKHQYIIGVSIGTGVVFAGALLMVGMEYTELERLRQACVQSNVPCPSVRTGDAFVRFASYGLIAMIQSFVVFVVSGWFEDRARNQPFDSRWT